MAHTYSHLFGLPNTGLRFFTVYGPWGRPDMAPFLFTRAILAQKPIQVFNYGNLARDFTFVGDIVEGIVRVIDNPPVSDQMSADSGKIQTKTPYKIYNIGNSSPVPLMEFIEAIENSIGIKSIREYLPMQPGDVNRTEADVSELINELGYKPDTPIAVGIQKFIDWYKQFYAVKI